MKQAGRTPSSSVRFFRFIRFLTPLCRFWFSRACFEHFTFRFLCRFDIAESVSIVSICKVAPKYADRRTEVRDGDEVSEEEVRWMGMRKEVRRRLIRKGQEGKTYSIPKSTSGILVNIPKLFVTLPSSVSFLATSNLYFSTILNNSSWGS